MQQSNIEMERLQTGRWTKEEHERFMYAIMTYGKDWKKVEQYVRTRSGSQVRSHAQKFFNKLQKTNQRQEPLQRNQQQFSQTDFDIQRQLNNEITPSTPMELVSFIKKQSKEEGGQINLQNLKQKLAEKGQEIKKEEMPQSLARNNSFKSMSNILSAYEEVNSEKSQKIVEDQSFLILLTKKYKSMFRKIGDFDKLIDMSNSPVIGGENPGRKRSFTLPQGNQLEGEQLDQKLEEIKKKINTESEKKTKSTTIITKGEEKKEGKSNHKDSEQIPMNLNRLSTIQEQARQDEEFNSFRVVPTEEDKEEEKPSQK